MCLSKTSWLSHWLVCCSQLTLALANCTHLFPILVFDISHSRSIYIMEISNLYKPASPPLFFLLESWLLNIYPFISVILNHRYLVIWQHKWYWVFPDWASFPRDMIVCHYIRIMKNDTRGYSVQNVPDYWPTVSIGGRRNLENSYKLPPLSSGGARNNDSLENIE